MKKFLPFIIGALVIVLIIVLMPARKQEKYFEGKVTLSIRDHLPYGCYATYHLLPALFPGVTITQNRNEPALWKELSLDSGHQVLLIVVKYFNPTETELDYLTAFAQKGNCVLISAVEMNYEARNFFKIRQLYLDIEKGDKILAGEPLFNASRQFAVRLDSNIVPHAQWFHYPGLRYVNDFERMDSSFTTALGYSNGGDINLLGMRSVKGMLLLHSTPLTFSNFFVLYQDNYKYVQQLLSLMPVKPARIVWDEYFLSNMYKNAGHNSGGNMLGVLLSYENFRWAFWVTIVVIVLYLVTGVQRRQRMIPLVIKPANESLEFVSVIGKLYFEKGDHANLAMKLAHFFLEHVRTRYHLDTQYVNSAFAVHLAAKADIPAAMAEELVSYINEAQMGTITAARLTTFYGLLDTFYKTT